MFLSLSGYFEKDMLFLEKKIEAISRMLTRPSQGATSAEGSCSQSRHNVDATEKKWRVMMEYT